MRESALEAACCRYARRHRITPFKLWGNTAGDPDRVFIRGVRCWMVEFKSTAGRLSPVQKARHAELTALGHAVSVVRSVEEFRKMLDVYLQATV